jgi:Domain of unknown function (DUF4214)/EF hand
MADKTYSPESEEKIRALYAEFFGREPDEGGLAYFAGLLDQGADISDIIAGLASNEEAVNAGVQSLGGLEFGTPEDRAYYESFDVNKDKYLSPSERRKFAEATGQQFISGPGDFANPKDREFLASFDADKSGYLSSDERRAFAQATGQEYVSSNPADYGKPEDRDFFASFDTDKSGYLSPDERRAFAKATGQDYISSDVGDYAKPEDMAFFESFDKDKNRYLSPAEKRYYNEAIGIDASADQIKQLYKDLLGQEGDEAKIRSFDESAQNLNDIRKLLAGSEEAKKLGVQDLSTLTYGKPEDKTYYETFDVNKDGYISPSERTAFENAQKTSAVGGTFKDTGEEAMRGDRVGKGVAVTGANSGLRDPYVDYVQTMLQRASAEADVPFQAYTKTPELITQATSGLKNLVTPGQFTAGSNLAQAAGLGALTYGNYQPTQFATGTFSNPFVGQQQTQKPAGKAEGGVVEYQAGGDVNVGSDSSQQSAYTNMDYGMSNLQPMQYGGQNVTNVQASYMDPYMQNVTNIAKREAQRSSDIAGQREAAQAVSQGAFGGSRYGLVEAERQRNLGQQLSDLDIKGLQAAYTSGMGQFNTEQQRSLEAQKLGEQSRQFGADLGLKGLQTAIQAGSTLGNLGYSQNAADLARLKQQYDMGGSERAFDYNEFLRSEKYPYENLTFMKNMLSGLPTSAAPTGVDPLSQALSGGLSTAALIDLLTKSTSTNKTTP